MDMDMWCEDVSVWDVLGLCLSLCEAYSRYVNGSFENGLCVNHNIQISHFNNLSRSLKS